MTLSLQKISGEFFKGWLLHYLVILASAALVYSQIVSFEFTNWDDDKNISKNPCLQKLTVENVKSILSPGAMPGEQLYIPFTYLSYLMESTVFGMKSSVMHFDNLLLHLINAFLVYSLAFLLFKNRTASLICALLFTLHPLQVEAVAWAMGRKDLLMTMFSLLCLLKFSDFINTKSKKSYMFSLILFFAAVFSKPSAFVLPVILPVLNWYFNGKTDKAFLLRILPFFVMSVVACLINSKLDMNNFGHELKFVMFRVVFIPAVAEDWLSRLFLLQNPEAYYSWYDYYDGSCITVGGLILIVSILVVTAYAFYRKLKTIFLGMSFLIVMSIPASLLVSWSFRDFITADRYGYFPLIGVFLIAGSVILISTSRIYRAVSLCAISFFIIISAWRSCHQAEIWKNSETLWKSVEKSHPDSYFAHYNLGNYYFKSKYDLKASEYHYRKANSITPDSDAWFNTGIMCELTNRKDESVVCYARAVALNPESPYALKKYALACYGKGELETALRCFLRLTELTPDSPEVYFYCGKIFDIKGQKEMAAEAFALYEKLKKQSK
ncbi:MAG TPA: hypothetical protein DCZ94_14810 [Lentisphaeria bacterium]|nr:MAG: hypothetical protein A2X48_02965 [Lentisphaerae bacterium GWF2_49_21]HBC88219.1 hypothetical protein [Lentisphaeria bacterium]